MPVRSSFTAGEVLTAADLTDTFASKVDYALTANAQNGTGASAYTFVLADASRLTTATGATAKTFTIPPQANVAWVANSIIRVANYGTGDLTIAGGSGVTVTNASKTLAQFESAALVRTGSNAWTLIPFSGGAGNANFSDAADGTYTDGGFTWKWKRYTASGTLTITRAGFADILVLGGGGGGGGGVTNNSGGGGGGAGGYLAISNAYLPPQTLTVTVGGGGTGNPANTSVSPNNSGNPSRLDVFFALGGGVGADGTNGRTGFNGGSGGGGVAAGGSGTSGVGNSGGTGFFTFGSGGGGGGSNAVGGNATTVAPAIAGAGGAGTSSGLTDPTTPVTRGGGGGGGSFGTTTTAGAGGSGGGGAGANNANAGSAGSANTGGGGGGGGSASGGAGAGGNGGSGVVIVRVRV